MVLELTTALGIERSNCKLPSRKGAPLIAVKGLELASVIRKDSCHFEWALELRLDKFEQICGYWRIKTKSRAKRRMALNFFRSLAKDR